MRLPQNSRPLRSLLLATVVVIVTAGCGTSEPDGATPATDATARPTTAPPTTSTSTAGPGTAPTQALTVDQMAAAVGCTPEPVVKAADFRQVLCMAPQGKLVLLDFNTVEGQRGWLDTALAYGGNYLVGDRWVVSADTLEDMETLRSRWGGTIEGEH